MKIFIWGASGQGRVVLDILKENKNFEIIGFIDSNLNLKGKIIDGIPVLGDKGCLNDLKNKGIQAGIVAIGENRIRCEIADYLKTQGFDLINAIHPKADISNTVLIGTNVTINPGAIIGTQAVIEDNSIINTGAIVEHENIIKNGAHIAPGVRLGGVVEVGERAFVGIGAVVIQALKIGKNSIIGAGAVVLKDVPDNVVAVGVPAKIIKERKQEDQYDV